MFCSVIIPTVGRETVERAIFSVLNQKLSPEEFEVIVVNDSGKALLNAEWQQLDRVRVVHTAHNERSVARNTGAAVARGEYLIFLDDDDWLLPGALQAFSQKISETGASVVYGGALLMDSPDKVIYEINLGVSGNCFSHAIGGEWIPTGSYAVKHDLFFQAGGFNPKISVLEDFDLTRRLAFEADFQSIDDSVLAIMRGSEWKTTTDQESSKKERELNSNAREAVLGKPNALKRLLASANDEYWRGKIVRAYLGTAWWNIEQRQIFTALERIAAGLIALAASVRYIFNTSFWHGLKDAHQSHIIHPANQEISATPPAVDSSAAYSLK